MVLVQWPTQDLTITAAKRTDLALLAHSIHGWYALHAVYRGSQPLGSDVDPSGIFPLGPFRKGPLPY